MINENPLFDVASRVLLGTTVLLWLSAGLVDNWVDVTTVQDDVHVPASENFTELQTYVFIDGKVSESSSKINLVRTNESRTEHFGIFKSELYGALSGKTNKTIMFNDCANGFDIGSYLNKQDGGTTDSCETTCTNKKWLYVGCSCVVFLNA